VKDNVVPLFDPMATAPEATFRQILAVESGCGRLARDLGRPCEDESAQEVPRLGIVIDARERFRSKAIPAVP